MAKIERKYMAHFINAAKEGQAVYERLARIWRNSLLRCLPRWRPRKISWVKALC